MAAAICFVDEVCLCRFINRLVGFGQKRSGIGYFLGLNKPLDFLNDIGKCALPAQIENPLPFGNSDSFFCGTRYRHSPETLAEVAEKRKF